MTHLNQIDLAVLAALIEKPKWFSELVGMTIGKRHISDDAIARAITKMQDLNLLRTKSDGRYLVISV